MEGWRKSGEKRGEKQCYSLYFGKQSASGTFQGHRAKTKHAEEPCAKSPHALAIRPEREMRSTQSQKNSLQRSRGAVRANPEKSADTRRSLSVKQTHRRQATIAKHMRAHTHASAQVHTHATRRQRPASSPINTSERDTYGRKAAEDNNSSEPRRAYRQRCLSMAGVSGASTLHPPAEEAAPRRRRRVETQDGEQRCCVKEDDSQLKLTEEQQERNRSSTTRRARTPYTVCVRRETAYTLTCSGRKHVNAGGATRDNLMSARVEMDL